MKRLFFITSSLNTVEKAEQELMEIGVNEDAMHLLSEDLAEAEVRNLHPVRSMNRTDILHWLERGLVVGGLIAVFILSLAYFSGLADQYSWMPFVFVALFLMAFATWEAGLIGMQEKNYKFEAFEENIRNGEHVLFVDCDEPQSSKVKDVCLNHYAMRFAGIDDSMIHPFAENKLHQ